MNTNVSQKECDIARNVGANLDGVELLSPCGDLRCLYSAVYNGASAVYLGLSQFSARASAVNFDYMQLKEGVRYAHLNQVKVYVTLNTLLTDSEINNAIELCRQAYELGVDAFILQDVYLCMPLRALFPNVEYHLSTQGGVCNAEGASFAKKMGFDRVIFARETALCDIERIAKIIDCEAFVQGALCTAFSGACLFSSFVGANSGNRGQCKQPCRKMYSLSGAKPCYALSTKDLCVKENIFTLAQSGVKSFKIEGRMRSAEYVGVATRYYRRLMQGVACEQDYDNLCRAYNRDFTRGLAFSRQGYLSKDSPANRGVEIGKILNVVKGIATVKTREKLCKEDGFKVTREGREVGSCIYLGETKNGVQLKLTGTARVGDTVNLTKDSKLSVFTDKLKRFKVQILVAFCAGKYPTAKAQFLHKNTQYEMMATGQIEAQTAINSSLSCSEVVECFSKLPTGLDAEISCQMGEVFYPKSALNSLRRDLYEKVTQKICQLNGFDTSRPTDQDKRINIPVTAISQTSVKGKIALISSDFCHINQHYDIGIFFPIDYCDASDAKRNAQQMGDKQKYLYIPPYFSGQDIQIAKKIVQYFDGIYCDNYDGYVLAEQFGKELFVGTACNTYNSIDVDYACKSADYFALSCELSSALSYGDKCFHHGSGDLALMHIVHCPYGANCDNCKGERIGTLTDQAKRTFTLLRYKASACRFVLYNCARLLNVQGDNLILNATLMTGEQTNELLRHCRDKEALKGILIQYTYGYK